MTNRPLLLDAAIAAAAVVFALAVFTVAPSADRGETANVVGLGLAVLGSVALVARRRHPVAVLAVVTLAWVGLVATVDGEHPLLLAAAVALYTVARTGERRVRLPIATAAAVVMMVTVAVVDEEAFWPELASEGVMLLPIAVAEAVRSRQERLENLIETEAAARVQAERLRIARDLHDVVAHGLSTIAVQSGVAARLLERDPALAKEALQDINRTGKRSLDELRAMVGVLRSDDGSPLQPTPTDPDDLSDLLAAASAAGLVVSVDVIGSFPPGVADAVVVATHRILQEALTNVTRHAGAVPVEVAVTHADRSATVRITNGPGRVDRPATPSTGVGVIGMTERAEALGGSLRAGPTTEGGFEVVADLPYYGRSQ
ncbi:MAG: sensor histidine kinase [Acidimicrobiales bacterium]